MTEPHVTTIRQGRIGIIELSRPTKFNAMDHAAFSAIGVAMDEFEQPGSQIRAVLLRAQGKHFCTGGDLEEASSMSGDDARLDAFLLHVQATLQRLEDSPLPVVAACKGLALAGGLEVLMACDVVFAASDARFGDQHVQYGLVPAWGATQRLPRRLGMARALDLMFSGRWLDAATAQQWGLVSYVVPPDELEVEAMRYCEALATRSRPGLAAMKQLARAGSAVSQDDGLRMERQAVLRIMRGPDPAEGIEAFRAKRPPDFKG